MAGATPELRGELADGLRSLKARLALIVSMVMIPALAYAAWLAFEAYADRRAERERLMATTLQVIATYEAEFFQRTRQLLQGLAANPAVMAPGCARLLVETRDHSADLLDLAVLGPDGGDRCGVEPVPAHAQGLPGLLERSTRGAQLAVGGLPRAGADGGDALLVAVPVRASVTGPPTGILAATASLAGLRRAVAGLDLPAGAVVALLDGEGRLLGLPDELRGAGDALGTTLLAGWRRQGDKVVTAATPDGLQRDFQLADVGSGSLFVVAGLPTVSHFGWLQRELVIGVFAPTLMLALAMITIWIASDLLVIRHVRTLAAAARAYSRGELDLRLDLDAAPSELRELAQTLSRMAARVRRRELELEASLAEKDLLLREVHHRVKNNLQIVSSLLNLRAQRLHSLAARDEVRQAQMRVAAMTLVHRRLYEDDDIRTIDLGGLLEDLCRLLDEANDRRQAAIELKVVAEPVQTPPDQAIPLALLVTEAVTNAFKHAFPPDLAGRIEVSLARSGQRALLSVSDDGVGLAGGADAGGMGVTLMRMLAKQAGGNLVLLEAQGTRIELEFPVALPTAAPDPAAKAGAPAAA
ncbi:MAG: histidine kinase dimerization/phosphoacceptor domain -containing protein [Geminicoccaceae bacterium]